MTNSAMATRSLPIRGMTCGSCIAHVDNALRSVEGVVTADVALGRAVVRYDPDRVAPEALEQAIAAAGYKVVPEAPGARGRGLRTPVLAGLVAAVGLAVFYILIIGLLSNDLTHGVNQVRDDALLVAPLMAGFGAQAGLFLYTRRALAMRVGQKAPAAMGASGVGVSTATMVACCAHHLTDILPFLGIAGLAVFALDYKAPLMLIGIASNAAGIGLMVWRLRRASCH